MWLQERIVNARLEARSLHRRFGVECVEHVDIYGFAERLGVQIVDVHMEGALAQLVANQRRTRILLSDRLVDPAMRRAAIAHELGHLLLNHPTAQLGDAREPGIAPMPRPIQMCSATQARDLEYEAHGFALELLTPAPSVEAFRRSDPTLELCSQLAMSAWIPMDYAALRIAETSDRLCAAVLSERDGILWVAASRSFTSVFGESLAGRLRQGQPLDGRTLASRILDRGTPCRPSPVPALAWLGTDGRELVEASAPVGPCGGVLTMLWPAAVEAALATVSSRWVH